MLSPELTFETAERTLENPSFEVMLGRLATARTSKEGNEQFLEIVRNIDWLDLQAGRLVELEQEKEAKLAAFMERPYQSVVSEAQLLRRLYANRSITDGNVTTFATRTNDRTDVDLVFRIIDRDDKDPWVTIETRLQNTLETPCRITARDGELKVSVEAYKSGLPYDHELPVHKNSDGEAKLRAYFLNTINATSESYKRLPEEIEAADRQAFRLLLAYREKQRTT